jgi:hypothetical protein
MTSWCSGLDHFILLSLDFTVSAQCSPQLLDAIEIFDRCRHDATLDDSTNINDLAESGKIKQKIETRSVSTLVRIGMDAAYE